MKGKGSKKVTLLAVIIYCVFVGILWSVYRKAGVKHEIISALDGPLVQLIPTKLFPNEFDYEFVIAHYNENLDWLNPYANHCHIYHKGTEKIPRFKFRQWEKLPNVGREAHTYLYHIINNYDHLTDVTVFLQGNINIHEHFCYMNILDYVKKAKKKCVSIKGHDINRVWGRLHHIGKWKQELLSGKMRRANLTMGEFWERIYGSPHPTSVTRQLAGCFAVTRECILKHSKKFYENIISFVSDHVNPEEGHYLERLWVGIFTHF